MAASDGVSILIVPLVVIVVLLSAAPAPAQRSRMAVYVIESLGSVRKLSLSPTYAYTKECAVFYRCNSEAK